MNGSLFNRLLVTLAVSLLVLWLVTATLAAWSAHREAGALHDRQLAQTAQVLLALAGQEIVEHLEEGTAPRDAPSPSADEIGLAGLATHLSRYAPSAGLAFHIHATGESFQFRSGNFPRGLDDEGIASGFMDRDFDGEPWRVYTRRDEHNIVAVQVAQRATERRRIGDAIIGAILPPLVAGLPLAVALTLVHVRRARRPLADLAAALAERGPDHLDPITVVRPPREIAPIIGALNRLVERVREHMARERRFTDDAAHELRTPLAALHTDVELALESDGPRRDAALARLRAGTRRCARLVGQMLALARLDPIAGIDDPKPIEIGACAQQMLSLLAPAATRHGVTVSLDEDPAAWTDGHPMLIETLLRNLLENAIRYTPPGGSVTVRTSTSAGHAILSVSDTGPGIPAAERGQVLQRFYRGSTAGPTGSGLGLSIVARVAKLHRATLDLADALPGGGLVVTVTFPLRRVVAGSTEGAR